MESEIKEGEEKQRNAIKLWAKDILSVSGVIESFEIRDNKAFREAVKNMAAKLNVSIYKVERREAWEQFIANDAEKPIHFQLFKTLHKHRKELDEVIEKEDREKIMMKKEKENETMETQGTTKDDYIPLIDIINIKEKTGRNVADVLFEIFLEIPTLTDDDCATTVEIPAYLTESQRMLSSYLCEDYPVRYTLCLH